MGVVTDYVASAHGLLDDAAESGFTAIVGSMGTLTTTAATLAVVLLGVNLILQYRPMTLGAVVVTMIKLMVIAWIGLQWGQFNLIASAIETAMNGIGGALIDHSLGSTSIADALDQVISKISESANAALEPMGWMGGAVLGGILTVALSAIGGLAAIILTWGKVLLTIHLMIAPLFIVLSMFPTTQDYFNRWLQSAVSATLFPVVIGAVLGAMVRLTNAYIDGLSIEAAGDTISGFIGYLVALLVLAISIIMIPSIVKSLSGNFGVVGPLAAAAGTAMMVKQAMSLGGMGRSGGNNPSGPNGGGGAGPAPVSAPVRAANHPPVTNEAGKIWSRCQKYK